jgi:hypothetical protein
MSTIARQWREKRRRSLLAVRDGFSGAAGVDIVASVKGVVPRASTEVVVPATAFDVVVAEKPCERIVEVVTNQGVVSVAGKHVLDGPDLVESARCTGDAQDQVDQDRNIPEPEQPVASLRAGRPPMKQIRA